MSGRTFFGENWKWLFLLAIISTLAALVRFSWVYPDSEMYLLLVSFFRGAIPISDTVEPFSYRPLLPLIAALLPFKPELVFAAINTIFVILLSWTLFSLSCEFGYSKQASFFSSGLCSFSWVVAYYGAAVLVDAGAILCLSLALRMIYRNQSDFLISLVLTIGVLFKEIAIVGILASILWQRRIKPLTLFLPISTHLLVRFIFSKEQTGYLWYFHLDSFGIYLDATIKTLGLTLGPFLILFLVALAFRKKDMKNFEDSIKWSLIIGIPCLAILFMGLFMAHFDSRFVWPLYPALIPSVSFGFTKIIEKIQSSLPIINRKGIQSEVA